MRWWPRRRRRRRGRSWLETVPRTARHRYDPLAAHPGRHDRIPDGDTVLLPGQIPWADLIHPDPLNEPTAQYRTIRVPPWVPRPGRPR
jgi:hypothetical protein